MKTAPLFLPVLLYAALSFSQSPSSTFLTWMKGDNTVNQVGIYGTQGMAAAVNKPGARDFSATWKDNNGNLWLFGGLGYDTNKEGFLNDLWKFDVSNNQWTWVKGDQDANQTARYGTQGSPHSLNKPGAIYAGASWTDKSGNLWLFGGFGYTDNSPGFLDDLWKYTPSTNKWTWVKGDKTIDGRGVYGAQGVPNSHNQPGSRYGSRTWSDADGNMWLFGGYGHDYSDATGYLNDLWKYNPSTNQWTWLKGDSLVNAPGIYGTPGIPGNNNKPGSRYMSFSWTDSNNDLWLFGGRGLNGNSPGSFNDLWKYVASTNQWTWIKGDSLINKSGVYGTAGMADQYTMPGARYVSVSWTDLTGNLWLFGGYGYASNREGYLNDLWKYNPAVNKWTWIKGDNNIDQTGVYGSLGMPSVFNKLGARTSCVSWTGNSGDLWLFGGYGFDATASGKLNDLWKITPLGAILPLQLFHFSGVLNNDIASLTWQTAQELNFSFFTVQRSFDGINFSDIGRINGRGNLYRSDYCYEDNDLQNRTGPKVFYRLQLTDRGGKVSYSKTIRLDRSPVNLSLQIFPNPAVQTLNLSFNQRQGGKLVISITNMPGVKLIEQTGNAAAGRICMNLDVSALPAATYVLSLTNEWGTVQQKFLKQ